MSDPFELHEGDALEVLRDLPADSFDGMLTDPPYGLEFMGRAWDALVPGPDVWAEALRVLKPGAHALVFGGTRTWHRLAVALEDAGFELRDTLMWLYGSGFPKSHDVSKAIDQAAGAEREVLGVSENWRESKRGREAFGSMEVRGEGAGLLTGPATPDAERWDGYGTALKPAWEPVLLVRKPSGRTVAATALQQGTGALNIDGARIDADGRPLRETDPKPGANGAVYAGRQAPGGGFDGGSRAAGETSLGRWPANVILDEAAAAQLDEQTGDLPLGHWPTDRGRNAFGFGHTGQAELDERHATEGGASRFFYTAKASREEREAGLSRLPIRPVARSNGGQTNVAGGDDGADPGEGGAFNRVVTRRNTHPTVKPLDLCRYLALLIKPPARDDGEPRQILVPFAGSGSEMIGALTAGWDVAVGVEREAEYVRIARARLQHHTAQPRLFEATP